MQNTRNKLNNWYTDYIIINIYKNGNIKYGNYRHFT